MRKTLKALPSTRWSIYCLAFILLLAVLFYQAFLTDYITSIRILAKAAPAKAFEKFFPVYSTFFLSSAVTLLFLGLYFLRLSYDALKSGEFPPPGTAVIHDTPVDEGPAARRKAAFGLSLAALFLIFGLTLPYIAFEFIHQLTRYLK